MNWETLKRQCKERLSVHLVSDHLEFLPAAIEVEQCPPSPGGRAILWAIMVLFVIALVWASLGHINIVAVASGQVVPVGQVKTVQSMVLGRVADIHVKEGAAVAKDAPLITLDGTVTEADLARLQIQYDTKRIQLARWQAYVAYLQRAQSGEAGDMAHVDMVLSDDLARHPQSGFERQLLLAEVANFQSAQTQLGYQIQAKINEQKSAMDIAEKLSQTLPLVSEKMNAVESLYQRNLASRSNYLDLKREHIDQAGSRSAAQHQVAQMKAEIELLKNQRSLMFAQAIRDGMNQQEQLNEAILGLKNELVEAQENNRQRHLLAPVDGVVQELSVTTLGGVVEPARPLMKIVPANGDLYVEAWVLNQDVGFVQKDMPVQIKVNTFNFTRYGMLHGKVANVSADAVSDPEQGLRYRVKVALESAVLPSTEGEYRIAPGMAVTAEIKTGERTIMEYFLSRFETVVSESLDER